MGTCFQGAGPPPVGNAVPGCHDCSGCYNGCQGFCLGTYLGSPKCQAVSQHFSCAIPTTKRDDIIIKKLPKTKVQEIMTYLYNGSKKGDLSPSGPKNATVNGGDFLKATDINQILAQLKTLNDCNPGPDYARDQIIYGSDINRILNLIRNAQLDGGCAGGPACDKCNATCDSCYYCNSCA